MTRMSSIDAHGKRQDWDVIETPNRAPDRRAPGDTNAPRALSWRALAAQSFSPFGIVVCAGAREDGLVVNRGRALRWTLPAGLDAAEGTAPSLAVYRVSPSSVPVPVTELERHPRSVQAFVPMSAGRFLVVACPDAPDGEPDADGLRAFVGSAGQGIVYRRGCWHHPMVALDGAMDFAMLIWERGDAGDCERVALARAHRVVPGHQTTSEGGLG